MTPFKLTDELLAQIEELISNHSDSRLLGMMEEIHYADVAEIANELSAEQATYLIKLLDSDKTSDVLTELDEDVREAVLNNLSSKEIAEELDELDSDDAADIIAELPDNIVQNTHRTLLSCLNTRRIPQADSWRRRWSR